MALQNIKKSVPMKVNKKPIVADGVGQSSPKTDYIVAVGRRKNATARIRLYRGKGQSMVNNKPIAEYFKSVDPHGMVFMKPFGVIEAPAVYMTVKISGSGLYAQEDAVVHGLSRALVKLDPTFKDALKKAGLLTRDARMRESRKIGTGGKARRRKQSPKR